MFVAVAIAAAVLAANAAAPIPAEAANSIDRQAIVDYAYRYWHNYNPDYRDFNNTGSRGGDCTNFVSQALRAGGWRDVWGLDYKSTSVWWYWKWPPFQSWTWVNANKFFWFASGSGRADIVNISADLNRRFTLQLGDIVQIDYERDGEMDHSMIVTKKDGYDIYLTYHTTLGRDRQDHKFLDIYGGSPGAAYYGWHLHDS